MDSFKISIHLGKSVGFGIHVRWRFYFSIEIELPFTYIEILPSGRRWFDFYNSFKE